MTASEQRDYDRTIQLSKPYGIPVYRVSLVRDSKLVSGTRQVRSSRDSRDVLVAYLGDTDREHFIVMLLDQKNKIIGINTVSIGSLTASVVHPRESFLPALLKNIATDMILNKCAAVVFGHNHPSGDPQPSAEDRALTERLTEVGKLLSIPVLDHIIVGDGTELYFSFADEGLLNGRKP